MSLSRVVYLLMVFWVRICSYSEFWTVSRLIDKEVHSWFLPRTLDPRHMLSVGWSSPTFNRRPPGLTQKSLWQLFHSNRLPEFLCICPFLASYSSDLSPQDFFLLSYVKNNVYRDPPKIHRKVENRDNKYDKVDCNLATQTRYREFRELRFLVWVVFFRLKEMVFRHWYC